MYFEARTNGMEKIPKNEKFRIEVCPICSVPRKVCSAVCNCELIGNFRLLSCLSSRGRDTSYPRASPSSLSLSRMNSLTLFLMNLKSKYLHEVQCRQTICGSINVFFKFQIQFYLVFLLCRFRKRHVPTER